MRKACRHCRRAGREVRGRGLCYSCHRDRAVRVLYPRATDRRTASDPEVSEAELDAIIAAQRATMPGPDLGRGRQPRRADYWATRSAVYKADDEPAGWAGWLRGHGDGYELHPDTEPDAIARDQRAAVRAALEELGAGWTVDRVCEAAVLPAWVVTRRLEELGVL